MNVVFFISDLDYPLKRRVSISVIGRYDKSDVYISVASPWLTRMIELFIGPKDGYVAEIHRIVGVE